jgi:hypothetical protein
MVTKPTKVVATGMSATLSRVLEAMVKDPERKQPPTLRDVRTALLESGMQWSGEGELLHPQDETSLIIELDDLINEYGEGTSATEFVNAEPK